MRIHVDLDTVKVSAPEIERELRNELRNIVAALVALQPPKPLPRLKVVGIMEIPRKKGNQPMIQTGNHFFDKVKVRIQLSPDGALDGPPQWTSDNPDIVLEPTTDGLTCDCSANGDIAAPATVIVTAPVDVPSTPDLETISESFQMTWSHSKATNLNPTLTEIPK